MKLTSEEEEQTLIKERQGGKKIGGRQKDYIDFINYNKNNDQVIAEADLDKQEITMVGFSAKDYKTNWVAEGKPNDKYETYDDRKKKRGFNDFETMSNTQRQKCPALKLRKVKNDVGLVYDRAELEEVENDYLKEEIEGMFNDLDRQLRATLDIEEASNNDDDEEEEDDE